MPLLGAVLSLGVFALICLLVILIVEWIAGLFGVPGNILMVIRAIFALIFLCYLLAIVFGGADVGFPLVRWPPH